jgi:hypothetical protein
MRLPKRNKMDKKKIIKLDLNRKYIQPIIGMKPVGFWYSCFNSWLNWTQDEGLFIKNYIHKINIKRNLLRNIKNKDKDGLLVLNNIKDLILFHKKYKKRYRKMNMIEWNKVSEDYGGIEICPYFKEELKKKKLWKKLFWYWSWDVASGCIWNISILKNTELMYKRVKKRKRDCTGCAVLDYEYIRV